MQKKIYFVSDAHLGMPNHERSLVRERLLVQWLDTVQADAEAIFLMGDLLDFWFEWRSVVPRGFVRFLGKVAEITDKGIPVHWFTGNHDLWIKDYLGTEIGVIVHRDPLMYEWGGKTFYLAHGDGLGPGEYTYKTLKWVFRAPFFNWLFARLHPNFAIWIAHTWSRTGNTENSKVGTFYGDKELLVIHSEQTLKKQHFDHFIYGHRHIARQIPLHNSTITILGDWLAQFTYAVFDGNTLELKSYK